MEQLKYAHLQETLLIRYYESDVVEFLLTIASNSDKSQAHTSEWNVLVLEAIYNLLNRVNPKEIFLYSVSDGLVKMGKNTYFILYLKSIKIGKSRFG